MTYEALKLRTNPFAPVTRVDGREIRLDYYKGPLRPRKDELALRYYFDLYTWARRDSLGPLADDGRIQAFPDGGNSLGTAIVISGLSGTGRTSLEELLLYEIAHRSGSKSIVTDYSIQVSAKPAQDAGDFARMFIGEVQDYLDDIAEKSEAQKALVERLNAQRKDWIDSGDESSRNPEALFGAFARPVRRAFPNTPIVFRLDATHYLNSSDTWGPILRMLRQLADYVILSLSVKDDASLLQARLERDIRIFWIDAPRISADKMKSFLERRLAAERSNAEADLDPLFPFTEEALDALFAGTEQGKRVEHPISVAIQKLRRAFDKKYDEIAAAGAGVPVARLLITAEDMKRSFSI
jgi:hypothetical protein